MSEPVFDSARKALGFALNFKLELQRPVMSQMVADGRVRKLELADGSAITIAVRKSTRNEQLIGLDGAATAGFVLQNLSLLPEPEQLVLIAEVKAPLVVCSCGAPCCSGYRPNPQWRRAVLELCEHLKHEAELSRIPGKKGLSTAPELREAIVMRFFRGHVTIAAIASRMGITETTVANHQRRIVDWLTETQARAWRAIGHALDGSGIVGQIEGV